MRDLPQLVSVREEGVDRVHDVNGDHVDGLSLCDRNLLTAWQQGIRLGQEAINQILRNGIDGPLGPKRGR